MKLVMTNEYSYKKPNIDRHILVAVWRLWRVVMPGDFVRQLGWWLGGDEGSCS